MSCLPEVGNNNFLLIILQVCAHVVKGEGRMLHYAVGASLSGGSSGFSVDSGGGFCEDWMISERNKLFSRMNQSSMHRNHGAGQPRDLEAGQPRDLGACQPRDLETGQPRDLEADKHCLMV